MRIDRIVIGVDFSQPSNAAVDWTARNFPAAELTLVHCIELPHVPAFLGGRSESRERMLTLAREGATERLATLGHALAGVRVRTEVRECAPVEGLVAAVTAHAADLAVVATTGTRLGGNWRGRIGGTAERIARCSPVPVLLAARPRRTRPQKLLVALDDADITPHVLAWTRALAERFDAAVTAVHVVSSAVLTHVMTMAAVGGASDAEVSERVRDEFRDDTDGWINEMVSVGLDPARVTSEVDFGEPGQEIVAAAERCASDLIVIGSRGAGRVRRALLGSVVSEVLHWAPCPVLVVVDPEDEIELEPEES
jgi:nucleotide-binding universal stress UspA family protein